jgi:hypothetical protein
MYGTTGKESAALGSYYRRRRSGNHHHPEREGKPATPRRANTRGKVVRTSIPRPRPAVDPGRAPASGREKAWRTGGTSPPSRPWASNPP